MSLNSALKGSEGSASDPSRRQLQRELKKNMAVITALEALDVRFPTSKLLAGSDAMNPDPDYSAAYVVLHTDDPSGLAGYGFAFTIGRGNHLQTIALRSLSHLVVGRKVDEIVSDLGA